MSRRLSVNIRSTVLALALLSTAACDAATPPYDPGTPEDRGVKLVSWPAGAAGEYFGRSDIVWTLSGSEIFFDDQLGLRAVTVSTSAIRSIATNTFIEGVTRAMNGERIYYAHNLVTSAPYTDPNLRVARFHPAGGLEETVTLSNGIAEGMWVSPNEQFLAVNYALYNLQTGTRRDMGGRPHGFSPDGTKLLYQDPGGAGSQYQLMSTETNAQEAIHFQGNYTAHRWIANAPQMLTTEWSFPSPAAFVALVETNGITRETRELARFATSSTFVSVAWSPDGQSLAAWVEQDRARWNLFLIRPGTEPRIIASFRAPQGSSPGRIAFSPSGTAVAFSFLGIGSDSGLYVKTSF